MKFLKTLVSRLSKLKQFITGATDPVNKEDNISSLIITGLPDHVKRKNVISSLRTSFLEQTEMPANNIQPTLIALSGERGVIFTFSKPVPFQQALAIVGLPFVQAMHPERPILESDKILLDGKDSDVFKKSGISVYAR